jgi:2-dehydro-3-deoxy-D-arabinonate dehydratase
MDIVRYRSPNSTSARVGLHLDGRLVELESVSSLGELWAMPATELQQFVVAAASGPSIAVADVELLAPIDARTEVWASGVTYETSREARVEESTQADVYQRVYDAERPELFFKSVAWRVCGPGEQVAIRADSTLDVPEPELALVVNRFGEIVGYTICNDMSSRSIEGENPLYLPQAKIYSGGCALGPTIRPAWEIEDPYQLTISLTIQPGSGAESWRGETTTALLHRRLDEMVGYLMRSTVHPDGVVLSTGTCLVPPAPFTLHDSDVVTITIDHIGTLQNAVVRDDIHKGAT